MKTIAIAPNFAAWRDAARAALAAELPPDFILWDTSDAAQPARFNEAPAPLARGHAPRIPADFIDIAKRVACHADPERWALLYAILWRLTHGEPHLLEVATDSDVHALRAMAKAVHRDIHKMRAFVRFCEVPMADGPWFVAWFEPEHHIVEANAPFFRDR